MSEEVASNDEGAGQQVDGAGAVQPGVDVAVDGGGAAGGGSVGGGGPGGPGSGGGDGSRQRVAIEDEMRTSYLDYAMSVIIGRAIPDVRDGLKPVHRRILFSMHENKVVHTQSYKKSARIVGDVLGKYHPHGDQAVYDALVRMAQDFSLRYLLVDGQGNFGSVDGDPPAAMRYTEVRMERLASELLADIEKDTIDFGPNFDDSEQEPLVLPARFPNLLVNGSNGIAVGMATNVPPHNLREVVDATLRLIDDPALTVAELMEDDPEADLRGVKGPDFPTAGFIYGTRGIRDALETGRGRVVMRARAEVEPLAGKLDREQIVVTELPYQVNKAELLKKIVELTREKKVEGISDIRDESDRDGMRVVIELKRDAQGQIILNQLYRMTALQGTFGVNQLSIVGGRPQVLGLKGMLQNFIAHRRDVVTRRSRFELRQALAQREIVEGLGMAITEVDKVISTIRKSRDSEEARVALMQLELIGLEGFVQRAGRPEHEVEEARSRGIYRLNERQARAILDMRLARLTGLEQEKLAGEYRELCETITRLEAILGSDVLLMKLISGELREIRDRYGDERRTEIVPDAGEINLEDLVPDEEVTVTISRAGYIKRVPVREYRQQKRGGKGSKGMAPRDEDLVTKLFVTTNHAYILFLTDRGRAFLKRVFDIPEAGRAARGRAVVNFVQLNAEESIAAVVCIPESDFWDESHGLLTCTRRGKVKRTELWRYVYSEREFFGAEEYKGVKEFRANDERPPLPNIRQTGINGVAIEEGDSLLTAAIVGGDQEVLIGTAKGQSIRFTAAQVRPTGRDTMGVKGIELRAGDHVVGMGVIAVGAGGVSESERAEGDAPEDEIESVAATPDVGEEDVQGEAPEDPSSQYVLTVSELGYGKRVSVDRWPEGRNRGGLGVIAMGLSETTGELVRLSIVQPGDGLMAITDGGVVLRTEADTVPIHGSRNTRGVRIIRLSSDQRVVDVEPIPGTDEQESEPPPDGQVAGDPEEAGPAKVSGGDQDDPEETSG